MNKRSVLIVLTVMAGALAASADPLAKGSHERGAAESPRDQTQPGAPVPIWPEGVPGAIKEGGPETLAEGLVRNVHEPSVTPYPAPLRDALRAVRLLRSDAATWGIRPDRIGVIGFSAGGHLAASAATLFDAPEGRTGAPLDRVSGRPDFAILVYPVIVLTGPYAHNGSRGALIGDSPEPGLAESLSLDTRVTKDTPPAFLVHGATDTAVPPENSALFYLALRKAGVPAELHSFERGAHGFGLQPNHGPVSNWPQRCAEWMAAKGLIYIVGSLEDARSADGAGAGPVREVGREGHQPP